MTTEQALALRAPFAPAQIGKLPKPHKKDSPKGKCPECGGFHGLPAVHLDYVGHAAATDRLLQVDPEWTWRPMAKDGNGFPLLDARGGLWIELTICGVTRPGYGDEMMGKGMKEIIGDAIRNAAMRFGVALDLWSKEDIHRDEAPAGDEKSSLAPAPVQAPKPATAPPAAPQGTFGDGSGVWTGTNKFGKHFRGTGRPLPKGWFQKLKEDRDAAIQDLGGTRFGAEKNPNGTFEIVEFVDASMPTEREIDSKSDPNEELPF